MTDSEIKEAFLSAVDFHRAGKEQEAEALYRHVLEQNPRHVAAMTLLATIHAQRREFEEAARLLDVSLEL